MLLRDRYDCGSDLLDAVCGKRPSSLGKAEVRHPVAIERLQIRGFSLLLKTLAYREARLSL